MNHFFKKVGYGFCLNKIRFEAAEAVLKNFYGTFGPLRQFEILTKSKR
jgi:hypothetical protein